MTIIPSEAAPPFEAGGATITGYAAPSRGASEVSLWRITLAPGAISPLHEMDVEEVFLAVSGTAVTEVDGVESHIGAGDCLILPARTPFTIRAGTRQPFEAVACMTAGGKAIMLPGGETFVPPWAE